MRSCVAVTRYNGEHIMSQAQQSFASTTAQAVCVSKPVELDPTLLNLVVGGASQGPTGGWKISAEDKGPTGGW